MDNQHTSVNVYGEGDWKQLAAKFPGIEFQEFNDISSLREFLFYKKDQLFLVNQEQEKLQMRIDFSSPELKRRLRFFSKKKEPLLRAIGKVEADELIVDATAGLGRESFLLAASGFRVLGIERSPYLHILQTLALEAVYKEKELSIEQQRLNFCWGNSLELIPQLSEKPKVLYFDPMFPKTKKMAKVKKNMQILQKMDLSQGTALEMLTKALEMGVERVIFKRPREASMLEPELCREYYENDTIRYEIY